MMPSLYKDPDDLEHGRQKEERKGFNMPGGLHIYLSGA